MKSLLFVLAGGYLLTWLLIPWILLQNRSPVATLAWCWSIVLFPFLGPLAYFLIGSDRLRQERLRKRLALDGSDGSVALESPAPEIEAMIRGLPAPDQRLLRQLSAINRFATSSVSSVHLLLDAAQFYPSLEKAIDEAGHHVHVQFFVWQADEYGRRFLDALIRARRRGVETRLLIDRGGSQFLSDSEFKDYLEAGGKFAWFRTLVPARRRFSVHLRNHRKIQVIDGRCGFVGGMNVGREYAGEDEDIGPWRDMQIRVEGPAVAGLQQTFAEDWLYASDEWFSDPVYYPAMNVDGCPSQVIVDGPTIRENPIQMSVVAVLNEARSRVWLTAGYFVPNEPLLTALKIAASRGVDVRILVSEKSDHPFLVQIGRSYYEELLEFGVRIFEYGKGLNHAKVALCDDRWIMVGSANFDRRSMQLNFECNILLRHAETAEQLERILRGDMEKDSHEIDLETFKRRPFRQRLGESFFRPLAPML